MRTSNYRESEQITICIELIKGLVFSTACVVACYFYLTTGHRGADKNVTSAFNPRLHEEFLCDNFYVTIFM